MYITSSDQLKDFCKSLDSSDVLAVDTEFVRERTYFHRVGLIQVAGRNGCAAIDPILLDDLTPLLEIFKDPNKTKIFHAARQDLEILVRLCGQVIRVPEAIVLARSTTPAFHHNWASGCATRGQS